MTVFVNMSSAVFKVSSSMIAILKNTKGHNSNKDVGGVNVYVSSVHQLVILYIRTKSTKYLNTYKIIQWMQLPYLKLQNYKGA